MRIAALFVVCVGLSACRNDDLTGILTQLRVEPRAVDFGSAALGQTFSTEITVTNDTRSSVEVEWSPLEAPFTAQPPTSLRPGSNAFTLTFAPTEAGTFTGALALSASSKPAATVTIAGEAHRVVCNAPDDCHLGVLSLATGACEVTNAPNDTACGDESACIQAGRCFEGTCRGEPRSCDDENHCTVDGCVPGLGCTHLALECPGAGECMVGACNPSSGCTLQSVEDGTACGTERTCTAADVCIAGACVSRDPPDGFLCAERTPCRAAGVCEDDVCVQPPAETLHASWSFDGRLHDGGPGDAWSDAMITDSDDVVLSSYFNSAPLLHANRENPISLRSNARRCIIWNSYLMCADLPGAGVSANDLETGDEIWSYTTVREDVPQLAQPKIETFLARLVALSPTRLGVLFESRTLGTDGADTMCRRFSYVVLDQNGRSHGARFLEDSIFERCNHPHSFGAAVDTSGMLYVAFFPSYTSNPASPQAGACNGDPMCNFSRLFALTPKAEVKWVRESASRAGAGELAVANGRLFTEGAETFSTETGEMLAARDPVFGMGIASTAALLNAPEAQFFVATHGNFASSWVLRPGFAEAFVANQLNAATWRTSRGLKSIAVGFKFDTTLESPGDLSVFAVELDTGASAFQCRLYDTRDLHSFHIGRTGMVLMSRDIVTGVASCNRCDPRFAASRNRFQWFDLPTVTLGRASWNGAYGDASHSHREHRP